MTTVVEHLRARLLGDRTPTLKDLRKTEWSPEFEQLMRNRLLQGGYRYGRLNAPGKPQYDRIAGIIRRAEAYQKDGNLEHLVDIANTALLEFEEGRHSKRHFKAVDDGEHDEIIERKDRCLKAIL